MRVEPSCVGLVPYERDPRELACPFFHVKLQSENSSLRGIRTSPYIESAGALILNFLNYKTVSNKFLLFISYPVYGIML